MDQLPWPGIGLGAGWAAFLSLCVLMSRAVVRGDWIPRATHERELDAAQHDANEWRAEGRIKDQAIMTTLDQVKATGEQTGASLHDFIAALQKVLDVRPNNTGGTP